MFSMMYSCRKEITQMLVKAFSPVPGTTEVHQWKWKCVPVRQKFTANA